MYGCCEKCGESKELDEYYNELGQELYICADCRSNMSQDDMKELADNP